MRRSKKEDEVGHWRGSINLVTGIKESWLRDRSMFRPVAGQSDAEVSQDIVF
jgi:hypothetical protein